MSNAKRYTNAKRWSLYDYNNHTLCCFYNANANMRRRPKCSEIEFILQCEWVYKT